MRFTKPEDFDAVHAGCKACQRPTRRNKHIADFDAFEHFSRHHGVAELGDLRWVLHSRPLLPRERERRSYVPRNHESGY